jgi:hypothetical protein
LLQAPGAAGAFELAKIVELAAAWSSFMDDRWRPTSRQRELPVRAEAVEAHIAVWRVVADSFLRKRARAGVDMGGWRWDR